MASDQKWVSGEGSPSALKYETLRLKRTVYGGGGIRPDVSVCWLAELVYAISMLTICGLYLRSNRWKGTRI